jgi:predicted metalloprotease with PDZ domain
MECSIRRGQQLVKINGENLSNLFNKIITLQNSGDKISLTLFHNGQLKDIEVIFGKKTEKSFRITPVENPDSSQKQILEGWLKG